ncbi:hypothetical protein [Kitasatospora sp. NPDC094016]|uniref:hypothetical protein n=1 Tax=Kitasatospora sp. NPDC094016 TaxID=3154986 RepID=UPI00331A274C
MTVPAEVLPTLAEIGAGRLPEPPDEDDGNAWVLGDCWLYCGRTSVRVLWLGPVTAAGGISAALHACAKCVAELHRRAVAAMTERDAPKTDPNRRPRHARPRTPSPLWATWFRLPNTDPTT